MKINIDVLNRQIEAHRIVEWANASVYGLYEYEFTQIKLIHKQYLC